MSARHWTAIGVLFIALALGWLGPALDAAEQAQEALNTAEADYLFAQQQAKREAAERDAAPNGRRVRKVASK